MRLKVIAMAGILISVLITTSISVVSADGPDKLGTSNGHLTFAPAEPEDDPEDSTPADEVSPSEGGRTGGFFCFAGGSSGDIPTDLPLILAIVIIVGFRKAIRDSIGTLTSSHLRVASK